MTPLSVIIAIFILSAIAPFVIRRHKTPEVWITLIIVNVIIMSLYYIVRGT